jgi:hypothetical protein
MGPPHLAAMSLVSCWWALSARDLASTSCRSTWIEDADSRVDIVPTALENLQGVWRLATDRWIESVSARLRPVFSSRL